MPLRAQSEYIALVVLMGNAADVSGELEYSAPAVEELLCLR
jgi:hypothetical protein